MRKPHPSRPCPVPTLLALAATLASGLAALAALLALPTATEAQHPAQHPAHHHDHGDVGVVEFQVACDDAVRADFDHAVAMLHHMMYYEAGEEFARIAELDPACGMAHWGMAVAGFQPLWPGRPSAEERRAGWAAVQRARELGVRTERERALLDAAEAFYRDPDDDAWWPRIHRWRESLEQAHRRLPDDIEVGAFYALALMSAGQAGEDQVGHHARAAEVLEEVYAQQPLHPGAIHYTIHADDIAGREGQSLDVVRSYDRIAPDVPHALHMPSHIFVRLGEWPDVIDWNRRSADAALRYPTAGRLSIHFPHALDYLLYAHLQRGDDAAARAVLDELKSQDLEYVENFVSAFHLAVMPARWAVERRAWDEAAALQPRTPDYLDWDRYGWPEALAWFARGLGAARTGDLAVAREAEARMVTLRDRARAADEANFATYIEVDRLILDGWLAHAAGDADRAIARMHDAARLEQTVQKHIVTPGALLPPNEALGDLLLELDRPADALQAYQRSLEIWPNRYHSLLGAARAAQAAGDTATARAHYTRLREVTEGATSSRPGVLEARQAGG
jgi:tetratricopeptide (TPR) repeat protein